MCYPIILNSWSTFNFLESFEKVFSIVPSLLKNPQMEILSTFYQSKSKRIITFNHFTSQYKYLNFSLTYLFILLNSNLIIMDMYEKVKSLTKKQYKNVTISDDFCQNPLYIF